MEMEVDFKKIIRKHYEFLRESLEPEPLADYLFSDNKITPTQHDSILEKKRRAASNECLKILRNSETAFSSFITFLESDSARSFILEKLEKDMVEEIRVVMIGKTGVGKSSLGNNILDHKSFSSLGCSQSIPKQNKRGERMVDKYCKLVLVDTPGLFDTNTKDNMETAKILASTVKQTKPGPHIFLLVVSIGRFTAEERATVEFLKDLFGSHVTNYLIIIFTGKDTLDFDKLDFEIFINTASQDLKSIVEQCQGKMAINNRASREEITQSVDDILQLIKRVYLQNNKEHYTDELLAEAQKKYADERKEHEKLRLQVEEAHRRQRKAEEEKKNLEQDKTDDKNKFEALRKDKEEIQKKYEDERKEKEKLRLQTEEAYRRERKMEEEMANLEFKRDHDKNIIDEIHVVMFGKTGVGKSFLGNNILGGNVFQSEAAAQSVTKGAKRGERMIDGDYKLVLLDTPGLYDFESQNIMETGKILTKTVREIKPGPHVFIFVLSITNRYTKEENAAIEFLTDLFGNSVTDYLIIVFTKKDNIYRAHIDFNTYVDKAKNDQKNLLSQCRGYIGINNWASKEELTESINSLLQIIKDVYLQNNKQHYTDALLVEAEMKFAKKFRLVEEGAHRRERKLEEERKKVKWMFEREREYENFRKDITKQEAELKLRQSRM